MSELQLSLVALGAVAIVAVVVFNVWQERKARAKAERAFGIQKGDALFDAPKPLERVEPTIGEIAPVVESAAAAQPPAAEPDPLALDEPAAPEPVPQISSRVDTVAVILADAPVNHEQLRPLFEALRSHATPVNVEGIVEEQWRAVEGSSRSSWRELRVGLQLSSRAGPLDAAQIERFNQAVADFAAANQAVSQRESSEAAAGRARELDRFCADVDIEVAVNIVGQFGATLAVSRVKQLGLEHGLSETAAGDLVSFGPEGMPQFVVRRFGDADPKAAIAWPGITFALDLPHVAGSGVVFDAMVRMARAFAEALAAQLVDDNRKPLTEAGLASIRRSMEQIAADMEAHGVPAGSALAHRLFS